VRSQCGWMKPAWPIRLVGVQVTRGDLEAFGEFPAAPVTVGLSGHQVGDALPPGGRAGAGPGEVLAVRAGPGPASGRVQRRGGDSDGDGGDGGDGGTRASIVAGEVAGGGELDLAGAEAGRFAGAGWPGRPGDDAGQVSGTVGADSPCCGELIACRFQGGGEASPGRGWSRAGFPPR